MGSGDGGTAVQGLVVYPPGPDQVVDLPAGETPVIPIGKAHGDIQVLINLVDQVIDENGYVVDCAGIGTLQVFQHRGLDNLNPDESLRALILLRLVDRELFATDVLALLLPEVDDVD